MVPPGARSLFTLHWIYADPEEKPGKLESSKDFLQALENSALDRGDRSFHWPTGILTWQNAGWRLKDMLAFVVDVDGDTDPDKAVDWLVSRGYPDQETQNGYVYEFIFERQMTLTLGSTKPMGVLKHIRFEGMHWAIAEKWAINLSRVLSYQTIYGNLDVIAKHWAGG